MRLFKVFRILRAMDEIFALVSEAVKAMQDGKLTEDEAKTLIVRIYAILRVLK